MTTPRTTPDNLTVAYIAMGVNSYLHTIKPDHDKGYYAMVDHLGGEMGLIDAAIDYAIHLDTLADACPDATGIFLYEVAEPFGTWYAEHMHANKGEPQPLVILNMMRALITEWN